SPFVSPPTVSSRKDVKYALLPDVPFTFSVPPTISPIDLSNLTITPGPIVKVAPLATVRLPVNTYTMLVRFQLTLVVNVPVRISKPSIGVCDEEKPLIAGRSDAKALIADPLPETTLTFDKVGEDPLR